jgi:hypothetical protein
VPVGRAQNARVRSWRIEELDGELRPRRVADPMELVLVVVAILAVLLPRALAPQPATTRVVPTYEQAASSPPATSLSTVLALGANPLAPGACGTLTAATPAPTYAGAARAFARIDAAVTLARDPHWWWCVAGARFYDDGVEIVGRFIPIRETTGGPRPRVALRSGEITGDLAGFGVLGPGTFAAAGPYDVLRLRAVGHSGSREQYPAAIAMAHELRLRLSSIGGEWGFLRAAGIDRDPAVILAERDDDGDVRAIHLDTWSEFAVRLPLRR